MFLDKMTETFKILSIIGLACLSLAVLTHIVGLTTNKWVVTTFSADVDSIVKAIISNSNSKQNQISLGGVNSVNLEKLLNQMKSLALLRSLSFDVTISSGMKQICLDVEVKSDAIDKNVIETINRQIEVQAGMFVKCHSISHLSDLWKTYKTNLKRLGVKLNEEVKNIDGYFDALNTVKICIIAAAVFASLALFASFVKAPCLDISYKQWIVGIVVACALIAVLSSVAGVAVLKKEFNLKTDFEEQKETNLAELKKFSKPLYDQYATFFDILKITEKNGYSHILVCFGIVLLFAAVMVNIAELISGRKSKYGGYV